ncbi:hypothetical protein K456DRAFT_1168823 [Colletotrichum gloeosporioides 23]|nr:hypothetical protein K456DRAFT_1168823 [Colletotrichum gloeosporioides 23]
MRRCRHGTIDYLPTSIMACCSRCRSTMWTWTSRAPGAGGCGCLLPAESTSNGKRACMSFEDRTRQDDSGFARRHSLMTIAKDSIRIFRRGDWTPHSDQFLREWNRRDSCKTASVACPTESSSKVNNNDKHSMSTANTDHKCHHVRVSIAAVASTAALAVIVAVLHDWTRGPCLSPGSNRLTARGQRPWVR